jgi:hypothetical protein
MIFAVRKCALDVAVKGSHDADPGEHRRGAVAFGDQDQGFYCGLRRTAEPQHADGKPDCRSDPSHESAGPAFVCGSPGYVSSWHV